MYICKHIYVYTYISLERADNRTLLSLLSRCLSTPLFLVYYTHSPGASNNVASQAFLDVSPVPSLSSPALHPSSYIISSYKTPFIKLLPYPCKLPLRRGVSTTSGATRARRDQRHPLPTKWASLRLPPSRLLYLSASLSTSSTMYSLELWAFHSALYYTLSFTTTTMTTCQPSALSSQPSRKSFWLMRH